MIKVLILDDDKFYANKLADRLQEKAIHVDKAKDLHHAQKLLSSSLDIYDVFIIDQNHGENMNGIHVMKELLRLSPETEAILLIERNDPDIGWKAYEAGAYQCLAKPLEIRELILILHSLVLRKPVFYERAWFITLNELATKIHHVTSVDQVADLIVHGGSQLGFERVRLFLAEKDANGKIVFAGLKQIGIKMAQDFEGIRMPYKESIYARHVFDSKKLHFFKGAELGPGYLYQRVGVSTNYPPIGEWVSIPLLDTDDQCLGILSLDNAARPHKFNSAQRELIQLFGRLSAASLERAQRDERKNKVREFLAAVSREISLSGQATLDNLLKVVLDKIDDIIKVHNFMVVLWEEESQWLYFLLQVENGKELKWGWRKAEDSGMMAYLVKQNRPLFIPTNVEAYRKEHNIPQVGEKPAQSWMGAPMRIGSQAIGGVIIENDDRSYAYSEDDFLILQEIANQLASIIQTAWLHEQQQKFNEKLAILQKASETIMELAEHNEEWLWHATLTLATAHYGFGFNRAMLFMVEDGGTRLRGHMGIGHFTLKAAERDWQDQATSANNSFKEYLECLQNKKLGMTPVDQAMRELVISENEFVQGVLGRIVSGDDVTPVSAVDAQTQLPSTFLQRFGATNYVVVPARAGKRTVAVLVLDTIWEKAPQPIGSLDYIGTLANEAALIYENLRRKRAQQQLIELNHQILAQVHQQPLSQTLNQFCQAAKLVTSADLVTVLPLRGAPLRFELENLSSIGENKIDHVKRTDQPGSFTNHVLRSGTTTISDVGMYTEIYDNCTLSEHVFLKRELVRALIGVPIRLSEQNPPLGILYLNYRSVQDFTEQDVDIAEALARLAGTAIQQARDFGWMRNEKEAREDELTLSHEILREALMPDITEGQLISSLLLKIQKLLGLTNLHTRINIALILKEWQRAEGQNNEPVEARRQYYLDSTGNLSEDTFEQHLGLSNYVMQKRTLLNIPDISAKEWNGIYYNRNIGTQSELDVPIIRDDQEVIGVLNIESPLLETFNTEHEQMLTRLSLVAVLALDSIRRREGLRSLLDAGQAITQPIDLQETLHAIGKFVREILPDISVMTIWHEDPETLNLVLGNFFGVKYEEALLRERPKDEGAVNAIMKSSERVFAEDVHDYSLFQKSNFIRREGIIATAAFPLIVNQQSIGAMFLAYRNQHRFTKSERELLPILAQFVAIGVNDARLISATKKEKKRLEWALHVTEGVGSALDLVEVVTRARKALLDLYHDSISAVTIYHSDKHEMKILDSEELPYPIDNPDYPDYKNTRIIPVDDSSLIGHLAGKSLNSRQREYDILPDVREAKHNLPLLRDALSVIAMTLVSKDGALLGGLILESNELNRFNSEDVKIITGIAQQIQIAIERAKQSSALDFRNIVTDAMMWAADLAHDLNRETYSVRSWSQVLRGETEISDSGKHAIDQIEQALDRIVRDAPWKMEETAEIDLNVEVVKWTNEILEKYNRSISPTFELSPNQLKIYTSPPALNRILRHFIRNASKAMQNKGKIFIRTRCINESEAEIQVEDTGPGIANDNPLREEIFQKPISNRASGGLGLLFVRLLAEKIGGKVSLLPHQPKKGACFCIRLPLIPLN